jgi:hypothetical protein
MLQVLHLDVSKVDRVLHIGYAWEARGGARGPRTQSGSAGDVGPVWARGWRRAGARVGVEYDVRGKPSVAWASGHRLLSRRSDAG